MKIRGRDRTPQQLTRALWQRVGMVAAGFGAVLPQLTFGKAAGLRNNIVPRLQLRRFRATRAVAAVPAERETAMYARQLRTEGVCIFRWMNDAAALARFQKTNARHLRGFTTLHRFSERRGGACVLEGFVAGRRSNRLHPDFQIEEVVSFDLPGWRGVHGELPT